MSSKDLKKELAEVEEKIEKLEEFLEKSEVSEYLIGDYLSSAIEFVPEVLPVALLPALLGVSLYAEAIDSDMSIPGKVAMCALATPIALPSIGLSLILSLPFAIPVVAVSAVTGGVQTTYAAAHNARLAKAEAKLNKLKTKREELITKIQSTRK